jgi:hypothetical protein
LNDFEALNEVLPLVKTSVNNLIAGPDRTLGDLFDLTDWANSLEGSPTDTVSFVVVSLIEADTSRF